ncbi:MAG: hypothetical protein WA989_15565 [Henriciella sp.]|uniref:hypothetical protein n=1 Tax=Henriciella sp. TaxID=1968823 RepID=UPI003C7619B9
MSAERKINPQDLQTIATPAGEAEQQAAEARTNVADANERERVEPAPSPARKLQEQLHKTISGENKVSSVYDMGRILAASSGITAILGVFFFLGIW